jgi:hypothetical protein
MNQRGLQQHREKVEKAIIASGKTGTGVKITSLPN